MSATIGLCITAHPNVGFYCCKLIANESQIFEANWVEIWTVWEVRSHTARQSAVFGCLNIRSLLNKFDDVVELCRDRHIDLLCVTES